MFGRWVPARERSRAASFNLAAIPAGTLTAIIVTPFLAVKFGWPSVFYVFGVVGLIWLAFCCFLVSDEPEKDARMGKAEREMFRDEHEKGKSSDSEPIPWRALLTQKPVWAIIVAHFCNNWGLYVLLSWLPSYFASELGISLRSVWIYVAPPWIASFVIGNMVGVLADRLIAKGWTVTRVKDAQTAVILLTVSMGLSSFSFAGFASNHLDVAPRHAGILFGISNTFATIPGIVGVVLTGYLVDVTGTFASAFYLTAGMYALGLIVWQLFSTGEKII